MLRHLALSLALLTSTYTLAEEVESTDANQETAYISDKLTVFLHAGPSRQYRIIGSIQAGTELEVLDINTETKFTQVNNNSKTGWVESQYLTQQAGLKSQLEAAQAELAEQTTNLSAQTQTLAAKDEQILSLQQQVNQLEQSLSETQSLLTEKEQALSKVDTNNKESEQKVLLQWFLKGGGVLAGGVLLGYILTLLPKKRRREQW
ncbi:TIGR04211 family SH3 domain-containing protein [Catenovulum sp. SM1970]|uniref:TIGR04211 family SH3 domain-containing protein n=1 Tax=Marinifaba aquimaris TaxID=2741323 RepID=UPI001573C332|nr:TIGR04211 family SH3 domain-containing protein [Marinifaba aquimaris]NTS77186.1 TIGR04211 family SH3 domain-containing protein [Marinifaba aquimaris]